LDAHIPALSPFVNLDLRAPFLYDQSADISVMPCYGSYPSPTLSLQDVESGHRARYFVDRPADIPELSPLGSNSFLPLDMELTEAKQQAPCIRGSSAEIPSTNSQNEAAQTGLPLISHLWHPQLRARFYENLPADTPAKTSQLAGRALAGSLTSQSMCVWAKV